MKRLFFIFLIFINLISCNINKHVSGIIIWEYSPDLDFEKIANTSYEELLKKYPKSIFIDFSDVKQYSKTKFTFAMKNQIWEKQYLSNRDCYWDIDDTSYFSVVINGTHYLTGISYLCYLSAQIPDIPADKVILIPAKNGNLKFTNTIDDIDGYFGSKGINTLDYNFDELEKYFRNRLKLAK